MIQTQVRTNSESILSKNNEQVTPVFRLDSMINYTSRLLKKFENEESYNPYNGRNIKNLNNSIREIHADPK